MILTTTTALDPAVSSFVGTLKGLSLSAVLKIAVLIIVLLVLVKLLQKLFDRFLSRSRIDRSLYGFLRAGVKILLYFIAAIIVAGSLNIDVTSLIAVLSVAGLALSLALQGALSNLASGIVILTTKPLHAGDYVEIDGQEGYVEEIGMTYTKLASFDRKIIFIPNSTVTSGSIINYTVEGKRRVDITVTASYDAAVDGVKAALRSAVEQVPNFLPEPAVFVRVSAYEESAIAYTVRAWCESKDYWDCYYDLLEEIKRAFDQNGIHMTYPHLNVHVESGEQRVKSGE